MLIIGKVRPFPPFLANFGPQKNRNPDLPRTPIYRGFLPAPNTRGKSRFYCNRLRNAVMVSIFDKAITSSPCVPWLFDYFILWRLCQNSKDDRSRNVVIFGLKEMDEEKLSDKVDELFQHIEVKPHFESNRRDWNWVSTTKQFTFLQIGHLKNKPDNICSFWRWKRRQRRTWRDDIISEVVLFVVRKRYQSERYVYIS